MVRTTRTDIARNVIFSALLAAILLVTGTTALHAFQANPFGFGGDSSGEQTVSATALLSVTSVQPGETYPAALRVEIAPDWHINSSRPKNDAYIPAELTFDTVTPLTPHDAVYPEGHDVRLLEEMMSVYEGTVHIEFAVSIDKSAAPGTYTLPVRFTSQACNDKSCMPPVTVDANLEVIVGEEGQPLHTDLFGATTPAASDAPPEATLPSSEPPSDIDRLVAEYGFWGYLMALGLAFLTGLLLSFSPCTYPMIPITVSIFAGQERSVGRGFIMSLFYVGSMAVVYGIMGLIVSLVGGVFGAWLASPPVVIGIAVVFVVFSLSMFGLYELQVPMALRNRLGTTRGGGGVMGAIILGIVAALVVSPCVGPFVAGILLYVATSGSPLVGFLVLFVFALGLGTLFLIIGTFSSAITALPRSGEWMEQVKKFFGFVLLLMALYFLRTIVAADLIAVFTALLLLAFGVFGGGLDRLTSEMGFFARLKKLLGIIAILIGTYLLIGSMLMHGLILPPAAQWLPMAGEATGYSVQDPIAWETDLEKGLARAQAEAKPVVIDTWATWCANCKVLEQKTFHHPDVARALQDMVPIRLQLETADSPITQAFKARFGLKQYSLPTVLLLNRQGEVVKTIQGVIGPDEMLEEFGRL